MSMSAFWSRAGVEGIHCEIGYDEGSLPVDAAQPTEFEKWLKGKGIETVPYIGSTAVSIEPNVFVEEVLPVLTEYCDGGVQRTDGFDPYWVYQGGISL